MRASVGLALIALLSLDVVPCGGGRPTPRPPVVVKLGEHCGDGAQMRMCPKGATCCLADPRADYSDSICVKTSALAKEGKACGVTSGKCCVEPLKCKVKEKGKGDGICSR